MIARIVFALLLGAIPFYMGLRLLIQRQSLVLSFLAAFMVVTGVSAMFVYLTHESDEAMNFISVQGILLALIGLEVTRLRRKQEGAQRR